jgi:hypothetical protein
MKLDFGFLMQKKVLTLLMRCKVITKILPEQVFINTHSFSFIYYFYSTFQIGFVTNGME